MLGGVVSGWVGLVWMDGTRCGLRFTRDGFGGVGGGIGAVGG